MYSLYILTVARSFPRKGEPPPPHQPTPAHKVILGLLCSSSSTKAWQSSTPREKWSKTGYRVHAIDSTHSTQGDPHEDQIAHQLHVRTDSRSSPCFLVDVSISVSPHGSILADSVGLLRAFFLLPHPSGLPSHSTAGLPEHYLMLACECQHLTQSAAGCGLQRTVKLSSCL